MIKAILFDLDGTLLPMDEEKFISTYFPLLYQKVANKGIEADVFFKAMWKGVEAAVRNDGSRSNESAFWESFASLLGQEIIKEKPVFEAFYANEFNLARSSCGFEPRAMETIKALKKKGYELIVATNPIFPSPATFSRMKWAGLDREDFSLITTYENSSFCKPNPEYYVQILEKRNLQPSECLMVGNDAEEDMVASSIGIKCFLLTNNLINRKNLDIDRYPQGDFSQLWDFFDETLDGGFCLKEMKNGK